MMPIPPTESLSTPSHSAEASHLTQAPLLSLSAPHTPPRPHRHPTRRGLLALSCGMVLGLLSLVDLHPAQADSGAESLAGQWSGVYNCGSISRNPFTLTVKPPDNGQSTVLEGEFRFSVPNSNRDETGTYRVRGRLDHRSGDFRFVPNGWIDRPSGFQAVGFEGQLHANGLIIQGEIRGCLGPNSAFAAERVDATRSLEIQTATTGNSVEATGDTWQGVWEGQLQCKERIGNMAYRLTLFQHDDALAAAYTLDWPGRSNEVIQRRGIATGRVGADGQLSLDHRLWLTNSTRWKPQIQVASSAATDQLSGDVTGGMPANYRCERVTLTRTGDAQPPSVTETGLSGKAWGGYAQRGAGLPREEWLSRLNNNGTRQVMLSFAGSPDRLHGRLSGTAPIMAPPIQQDRYAYRLQPVTTLSDGRVAFLPMVMEQAQGRFERLGDFSWYTRRPYVVLFDITEDGELSVTHRDSRQRETVFRFPQLEGETLAAIQQGEAPSVPLGDAMQGALSQAPSLDQQCRILLDWAGQAVDQESLARMTGSQLQVAILPILKEAEFEPVFGIPVDLTTEEERSSVHTLSRICTYRTGNRLAQSVIGNFRSDIHLDRILALAMDHAETSGWQQDAIAAIHDLEDEDSSLARLTEIEREARERRGELSTSSQQQLTSAIASKRQQIATANLMRDVEAIPTLPDAARTIDKLAELFDRATQVDLPSGPASQLITLASEKAQRILQPLLQQADAMASGPVSLDSLASLTSLLSELEHLRARLPRQVRQSIDFGPVATATARRQALIQHPEVQQAFAAMLLRLEPGRDDPRDIVRRTALRYVDSRHLEGSTAMAHAAREATERLELRSVGLVDRSTQAVNGEPSAQAMYLAVKAKADQVNDQLASTYERCQRRQFQNDPMLAMTCLTILAAGGGDELRARITRFEKLGCARSEGQAGFVCDYVLGFETSSPFMRETMMGELMAMGSVSQGRFVPIREGWLFTPLRRNP